jgi:hypothetical protein
MLLTLVPVVSVVLRLSLHVTLMAVASIVLPSERKARVMLSSIQCTAFRQNSLGLRNGHHHLLKQGEFPTMACRSTSEDLGSDGKIHIDMLFSRNFGQTSDHGCRHDIHHCQGGLYLCCPASRVQYHVELAGGGHYSLAALRAKVVEIQSKISPGIGLTLNSLYIQ